MHEVRAPTSVSFNPVTKVSFVESVYDMSRREKRATWYTEKELVRVKADVWKIIRFHSAGKLDPYNDENCIRGIENVLSTNTRLEQENERKVVIQAVLAKQELHRKIGVLAPDSLAVASAAHSRKARTRAADMGAFDEMQVHMEAAKKM
mmetsp:Transcript_4149/g.5623  ORF Transcript_4149/g.5623 Transcript_4149/m.5623 type:complete len:149 (-) Transcript_4149:162-608(-)